MESRQKHVYVFENFRLDPIKRRLFNSGEVTIIPPKAFDLLLVMVRHPGMILEKDELMETVWPNTIVEEANLSVTVSTLRKALGEGANERRYIETLPRRGYRFIAEVTEAFEENIGRAASLHSPESESPQIGESKIHSHPTQAVNSDDEIALSISTNTSISYSQSVLNNIGAWIFSNYKSYLKVVSTVGLLLIIVTATFYIRRMNEQSNTSAHNLVLARAVPATSYPGREFSPAFSPEGDRLAFVWSGENDDNNDIYVKYIDEGNPLRLTTNIADDLNPKWSPDGQTVAFYRSSPNGAGVYLVSAMGGGERRLTDAHNQFGSLAIHGYLSWSADGKQIALSDNVSATEPYAIYLIQMDSGERKRLTKPPASVMGDSAPAFSPDGKRVAFARIDSSMVEDLYIVSTDGGEPVRLTFDHARISDIAWKTDGSELIFSSRRNGIQSLWRISVRGGNPIWVPINGSNLSGVTLSKKNHLAWVQATNNIDIQEINLSKQSSSTTAPEDLIVSTFIDNEPQFSPDGQKIAFSSARSGSSEIWVCENNGSRPRQLTEFNGPHCGSPRWSPDARQIVFDCRPNGNPDIYIINSEGGKPVRLTNEDSQDVLPSFSRDGKSVYFASNRSGNMQIWKMSVSGGPATKLTNDGGFEAFESFDKQWIYYTKGRGMSSIWRIPVGGGDETKLFNFSPSYSRLWCLTTNGIYFAELNSTEQTSFKFYQFENQLTSTAAVLAKRLPQGLSGIAISPNGKRLLFPQINQQGSDIMLMRGFR